MMIRGFSSQQVYTFVNTSVFSADGLRVSAVISR